MEVSEVADQEVDQEAEEAEAEANNSLNGVQTESLTALDWLRMAKTMSMSFIPNSNT